MSSVADDFRPLDERAFHSTQFVASRADSRPAVAGGVGGEAFEHLDLPVTLGAAVTR